MKSRRRLQGANLSLARGTGLSEKGHSAWPGHFESSYDWPNSSSQRAKPRRNCGNSLRTEHVAFQERPTLLDTYTKSYLDERIRLRFLSHRGQALVPVGISQSRRFQAETSPAPSTPSESLHEARQPWRGAFVPTRAPSAARTPFMAVRPVPTLPRCQK
jgi:hypothetical protein